MTSSALLEQPKHFSWKLAFGNVGYRVQFALSVATMIALALFFPTFFDYLEARQGAVLHDFLLDLIPAADVSWITFIFLYAGIFIGVGCNLFRPMNMLMALQTYVLVTLMRVVSLYFVHLNPPIGYIELKDPFLSRFLTTNGNICSHDLFFSGHVSTLLAVYFSLQQKRFKDTVLLFSVLVAVLILVQHVHYTIDIVVAPLATYLCYRLSKNIFLKRINLNNDVTLP